MFYCEWMPYFFVCHWPYLLLHAVEQGGVVTFLTDKLLMGAMLSNLAVLHQNNIIALRQILKRTWIFKKRKKLVSTFTVDTLSTFQS